MYNTAVSGMCIKLELRDSLTLFYVVNMVFHDGKEEG